MDSSTSSPLSLGIARAGSDNWGEFKGLMQDVRVFDSVLSDIEVSILAEKGSVQSFTTTIDPVPPWIEVRQAVDITESNATFKI